MSYSPNLESKVDMETPQWRYRVAEAARLIMGEVYDLGRGLRNLQSADFLTKKEAEKRFNPLAIRANLQLGGQAPLNLYGLPGSSQSPTIVDVWANLPAPQSQPIGMLFWASDRTVLYMAQDVSGARAWVYVLGIYRNTLANILTGLGANDAGLLNEITDYSHVLRWTGSAWTWGTGDNGSGYYQLFEDAPSGLGASAWQICDGSTIARLNADGTTTNVTLDDLTTAAYLKGGITSAAVAAASGVSGATSGGTPGGTTDNNSASQEVQSGTGVTVAANPHTHTFTGSALATHTHTPGTLELRNKQARLYYRR